MLSAAFMAVHVCVTAVVFTQSLLKCQMAPVCFFVNRTQWLSHTLTQHQCNIIQNRFPDSLCVLGLFVWCLCSGRGGGGGGVLQVSTLFSDGTEKRWTIHSFLSFMCPKAMGPVWLLVSCSFDHTPDWNAASLMHTHHHHTCNYTHKPSLTEGNVQYYNTKLSFIEIIIEIIFVFSILVY